ncbi:MAG TPA: hypothetical protein VK498_05870 [Ferruginibacter sp.]|nr:hypothetical protein [Ferruginibacter sp.]
MIFKNNIDRIICLIAFLFISHNYIDAQGIQTFKDRKQILIGERITYEVKINLASSGYQIQLYIPDSIPHFDILEKNKYDTVDKKGNYSLRQVIVFTSFDSGAWQFPSFPLTISSTGKMSRKFNTDSFLVNVGYSPADSSGQLRDIKPVMDVFVVDNSWIYAALIVLTVLILGWIIYRYLKNRKKKEKPLFQSSLSPYDEAIKNLKNLQKNYRAEPASIKEFHTGLSDIFKRYYSRKTQRNWLNTTTGDILIKLTEIEVGPAVLSAAAGALRVGDAVKFAKYLPPPDESERSLIQLKEVIDFLEKSNQVKL